MINYNGKLTAETDISIQTNRAFLYGDALFETIKVLDGRILFLEDHYFRLMASMRILRMEIPMSLTMEYMENEILKLIQESKVATASCRVRLTVFRNPGGFYLPEDNQTEFIITAFPLESVLYSLSNKTYEVDLFRDFYISKQLLSTLKTTNRLLHITGSIYASENKLDNCLLLNDEKNVAEALQGNLFIVVGKKLITPPVSDGCINGIMRKQILSIAEKTVGIEVVEQSVSPFDLQKADEMFITNVVTGIQPVSKYRKKEFSSIVAAELLKRLNASIRLA